MPVGHQARVDYIRDGRHLSATVELAERPATTTARLQAPDQNSEDSDTLQSSKLGISVQNVTPDVASQMKLKIPSGAVVVSVDRNGPAGQAGVGRDLAELAKRVRDGSFSVHLHHRNLDPVINRLVLGVMTAALIVGSSLLWSMKAPPTLGGVSIVGAAGYLVAVYLGSRLVRAIKQNGGVGEKRASCRMVPIC